MEHHFHADKPLGREQCSRQSVWILESTDRPAAESAFAGQRQYKSFILMQSVHYKNTSQFIDKSRRGWTTKIHRLVADDRPARKFSLPPWGKRAPRPKAAGYCAGKEKHASALSWMNLIDEDNEKRSGKHLRWG